MEEFSKEKKQQLAKNREVLIKKIVPACSKISTDKYRENYDRIFKRRK
jgi:hypothetical protein